jgi:glucan phosphoethanolaminetransferase (alkaline phosphatase superfamily)
MSMIPGLINLIVWLLIVGILVALVYWVVDVIPIPQPINRIIKVVLIVLVCLVVILMLLNLIGVSTGVRIPTG